MGKSKIRLHIVYFYTYMVAHFDILDKDHEIVDKYGSIPTGAKFLYLDIELIPFTNRRCQELFTYYVDLSALRTGGIRSIRAHEREILVHLIEEALEHVTLEDLDNKVASWFEDLLGTLEGGGGQVDGPCMVQAPVA